jgi:hypothetical protein
MQGTKEMHSALQLEKDSSTSRVSTGKEHSQDVEISSNTTRQHLEDFYDSKFFK